MRQLRSFFHRKLIDEQTDKELQFHVEQQVRDNIAAGMRPEEAQRAALIVFGGMAQIREQCREAWGIQWFENVLQDLRFGLRTQFKTPGVTVAVILTLAFAIAANSTVLSLVNSFFLRPLPIEEPGRLVRIYSSYAGGQQYFTMGYSDYSEIAGLNEVFSGVLADGPVPVNLGFGGASERLWGERVSRNYFSVLGVRPSHGRVFAPEEDWSSGPAPVVVLSYGLWQRRFNANPDVIGQDVSLNGQAHKIIGIAPAGFHGVNLGVRPDLWLPIIKERTSSSGYFAMGRLRPGVTTAEAGSAVDLLARHMRETYPSTKQGAHFTVLPESEGRIHPMARRGFVGVSAVSIAVSALVLLLACANIAGILFARAADRRKEIGARLALGATRGRIVRQLLTEGISLSLIAGGLGIAAAWGATRFLEAIHLPTRFPIFFDLGFDLRVLLFSFVVTALAASLFGLAPALEVSRADVMTVLRCGEAGSGPQVSQLRKSLVVGQVALSTVLLIAGGLFLRSLQNAQHTDLGFDPEGVVTASVDVGLQGYPVQKREQFWRRLVDRISMLQNVEAVSLASAVPFELNITTTTLAPEGYQPPPDHGWPSIEYSVVDIGYFDTLRIPFVEGRDFNDRDGKTTPPVVVVNDVLARRFWPGTSAVGKRLVHRDGSGCEIVAIVKRGKYLTLGEEPKPYIYFPLRQQPGAGAMTVLARAKYDSPALLRAVRDTVRSMDDAVPVYNVTTMLERADTALLVPRGEAAVLSIVNLIALLLTSVGFYGMMAHTVTGRTHEIGVRRALGAQNRDVILLVVRQGFVLVLLGLSGGILLGSVGARLLRRLLYGIPAWDALILGLTPIILLLVCVVASWMPTCRAARIDVATALRHE